MIYQFRTKMPNLDPNQVGCELERIRQVNDGHLKTEDVVSEAADAASPLHEAFTWDDAEAAQQHRMQQARYLIRNVQVAYDQRDPAPAFYNVIVEAADGKARYYQHISVLSSNPVEYEAALRTMRTKLAEAQKGLNQLLDVAPKRQQNKVRRATDYVGKAQQLLQA